MSHLFPVLACVTVGAALLANGARPMPEPDRAQSAPTLTRANASSFAKLALKGAKKEYPNKPGHVLLDDADAKTPRALHPAFYGCYDWHSAVHGHWMLAHLLRKFPDLPEAKEIRDVLNAHLTAENIKAEVEYFNRQEAKSFERPYGWSWLLKLAEELHGWDDADAKKWSAAVKPLAELIAARYVEYFPKQTYPIRAGVHSNTAFGFTFAHDYAPRGRRQEAPGADRGAREGLLREGRRCAGAVGTGRQRLPLAEPVRGGPDAPRATAGRVPRLVPQVPARRGEGRAEDALRARDRDRPHRPATRPPRRAEPEPRVVHARDRLGAGGR